MPNNVTEVLENFGTALAPGGSIEFRDLRKARTGYIHHTSVPVAAVAFTLLSPDFARERFPSMLLADVVLNRSSMDRSEVAALALLCGEAPPLLDAREFVAHLDDVIERHAMQAFFCRAPSRPASWGIDVRPRGVEWSTEEWDPPEMAAWRRAYRELTPSQQMMVATVIWLYRGKKQDNKWLARLPHKWHVAEALPALRAAGSLGDWSRLVATYQGW